MGVSETRILKWMLGIIKKDWLMNEFIQSRLGVTSIIHKLRENQLRWYEHIFRRLVDVPNKRRETFFSGGS